MDISKAVDLAVEAHTNRLIADMDKGEEISDEDYPPVVLELDDFIRDSSDILLDLTDDQFKDLRTNLGKTLWYHEHMIHGTSVDRAHDYMGTLASMSMDIVALLLGSLAKHNITTPESLGQ